MQNLFVLIDEYLFKTLGIKKNKFMNRNSKYSKYKIGQFSYGDPIILRWGEPSTLKIGKFCAIAEDVVILLGGEHHVDWVTTYPFNACFKDFQHFRGHPATKGDVVIGNDVWIGMKAMIMSGVKIGDGAVIGASSVVTKDVPPYAIAAGNPARLVRMRFDEATIVKLFRIKWWDWTIQRIKENMPLLLSGNIEEFVNKNLPPEVLP